MEKFTNPLKNIRIASPCPADWNEMIGNECRRFCGACKLNVYNLSGMSAREAENLILQSEDNRLCVRFYRRADGTVLTKDCPVGWQAIKRNVSKTATAFASLIFAALSGIGLASYFAKSNEHPLTKTKTEFEKPTLGNFAIDNSKIETDDHTSYVMGMMSNVSNKRDSTLSVGRIEFAGNRRAHIKKIANVNF